MVIVYIILSVVLISFLEYWIHRQAMHRGVPSKDNSTYRNHAIYHHGKFFKKFNHEPDEIGKQFNIKLDLVYDLAVFSPVLLLVWLFSPLFCYTLIGVTALHHGVWGVIHEEMHNPKYPVLRQYKLWRFYEEYHYWHHHYPNKNFNIVFPFFDWIYGTYHVPSKEDIDLRQKELGY